MRSLNCFALKSILFAFIAFLGMPVLAATPRLPEGTTVKKDDNPTTQGFKSFIVTSAYQKGPNKLEILLPDNLTSRRKYPVVYCLPVQDGPTGRWGHPLEEAKKRDLANRHQAIFVCPSYKILPWYGNNPDKPEYRQNQYLLDVVIPFVESKYPALAEARGRYLVGFSKSGLGALSIFLRDPGKFNKVAVFETFWGEPDAKQWAEWGFIPCYGTRENFDTYDPQHLLDASRKELEKGPSRIININGGPGLRLGVEIFEMLLRDRKIPHQYIADYTFSHDWKSGWFHLAIAALDPEGASAK